MSKSNDHKNFDLLKKAVAGQFLKENSTQSNDISDWKGQEIELFQEDLLNKTRSTVSEKWFYTYFKSDFKKLPRIDMLNLLSQYCDYANWADFIKNSTDLQKIIATEASPKQNRDFNTDSLLSSKEKDYLRNTKESMSLIKNSNTLNKVNKINKQYLIAVASFLILLFICLGIYFAVFYPKRYKFCFIDSDQGKPIKNSIGVTILRDDFTPSYFSTKTGCFSFESREKVIKMVANSAYHKKDTFVINLSQYRQPENIELKSDDYKLMLYYYSNSSKNLKLRIKKLNQMIADDALIYQVYDNDFFGVEILSKQQYINLVSLPTTSLKNFTLIESESKSGKINKLKFKIQQDEDKNQHNK